MTSLHYSLCWPQFMETLVHYSRRSPARRYANVAKMRGLVPRPTPPPASGLLGDLPLARVRVTCAVQGAWCLVPAHHRTPQRLHASSAKLNVANSSNFVVLVIGHIAQWSPPWRQFV